MTAPTPSKLQDAMLQSVNKLLFEAVASDDIDLVKSCVLRGATVDHEVEDKNGSRMDLHAFAFKNDHMRSFEYLVHMGASVEVKDSYGCTLLLQAAKNQRADKIKKCIELGADIYATSPSRDTFLDLVMRWPNSADRKEMIEFTLKHLPVVREDPDAAFNTAAAPDVTLKSGVRTVERIRLTPTDDSKGPQL